LSNVHDHVPALQEQLVEEVAQTVTDVGRARS